MVGSHVRPQTGSHFNIYLTQVAVVQHFEGEEKLEKRERKRSNRVGDRWRDRD